MSRCSVCKMFLHGVHLVTHWTVEDMLAVQVAPDGSDVFRRAPGRFADMPSRADRNRLRRLSEAGAPTRGLFAANPITAGPAAGTEAA